MIKNIANQKKMNLSKQNHIKIWKKSIKKMKKKISKINKENFGDLKLQIKIMI